MVQQTLTFEGGISTQLSEHLIAKNQGVICENVDLEKGSLHPLRGSILEEYSTGKDVYFHDGLLIKPNSNEDDRSYVEFGNNLYWTNSDYGSYGLMKLNKDGELDGEYSELTDATVMDYTDGQKILRSGSVYECILDAPAGTLLTNVTYFTLLGDARDKGVEATPPNKPNELITLSNTTESNQGFIVNDIYRYCYTFVDNDGLESPSYGLGVGAFNITANGNNINVSVASGGNAPDDLSSVRFYRASGTSFTYRLVKEIDIDKTGYDTNGIVSFIDNIGDDIVSARELTTFDNCNPPANLDNLIENNGVFFGSVNKRVYFSLQGQPEYWYELDYLVLENDCTGLGVFGDNILAFTKASVYQIAGYSRDTISMVKLPFNEGCVNKKSVANIGYFTLWTSQNGIAIYNGSTVDVVTKNIIAWDEFKRVGERTYDTLNTTFEAISGFDISYAVGFRDRYFGLYQGGICVIDLSEGSPKAFTVNQDELLGLAFNDVENILFMIIDNGSQYEINSFDSSEELLTAKWKSGKYQDEGYSVKKHYRDIELDSIPNTVKVYIDNKMIQVYNNRKRFKLPSGSIGHSIQFEITTNKEIKSLKYEYSLLKA